MSVLPHGIREVETIPPGNEHHEVRLSLLIDTGTVAEPYRSADQRAKANAEMAKSSGQATNAAAAPPAEKQHGQPGMDWQLAG